jgi:hypothetical protein
MSIPRETVIRPRVVKRGKKTDGPQPTMYQEKRKELIIRLKKERVVVVIKEVN